MNTPHEILVGVTGGVAAFKTAALVSQLVQQGHGVTVIMTAAAEKFIGSATFAALTGRPVAREIFDENSFPLGAHIELAQRGELFCVAPATADFLAKAATGQADDLLSTLYLAFQGPVLIAPAMNSAMWAHPAVKRNVAQLQQDGVELIGPDDGWLSCRQAGQGRMSAPEDLLKAIQAKLQLLPPRKS